MDLEELKNTLELADTLPTSVQTEIAKDLVTLRLQQEHARAVSNLEPMDDA